MRVSPLFLLLLGAALVGAQDYKVGMVSDDFPFTYSDGSGNLTGFEVDLTKTLCESMGASCTLVQLSSFADRIPSLENGTIDFVVAALSVTPERSTQVNMVHPFYYASGVALFVIKGSNITGWSDIAGKPVCSVETYYGNSVVEAAYSPTLVPGKTNADVVSDLVAGKCVAALSDSASLSFSQLAPAGTSIVSVGTTLEEAPYAIATAKNNFALGDMISGAFTRVFLSSGNTSQIFALEDEYVLGNGGAPLDALVPLVASISYLTA